MSFFTVFQTVLDAGKRWEDAAKTRFQKKSAKIEEKNWKNQNAKKNVGALQWTARRPASICVYHKYVYVYMQI